MYLSVVPVSARSTSDRCPAGAVLLQANLDKAALYFLNSEHKMLQLYHPRLEMAVSAGKITVLNLLVTYLIISGAEKMNKAKNVCLRETKSLIFILNTRNGQQIK